MSTFFDEKKLQELAETHSEQYQNNQPFPHIVIDNFMDNSVLDKVADAFPKPDSFDFYKYDNPLEKKLAFDQLSKLPEPITEILQAINQPVFLNFLEILTGIDGLIPDPYYRGGGIHQILPGGKLDIHIDFNKHQKLKLDRRLNVIIYLNRNWEESYGGHFELWTGEFKDGKHELKDCVNRILPLFNRLVVFSTSEKSYHGHPDPLTCPEDRARQSIATYYYSNGRPAEEDVPAHSTTFIKRPCDPDTEELNTLRENRNKGRFATNIKSGPTA